ncbi:unnamed protein product [Staurois parvus]|uniref:Uncharacterized protein n=1 Tax=Staurois parvus TaxID=386267 RepID=A0ABN9HLS7_9NEOB|nr:unnamed protein product [Staurois parvus]
MCPRYRLTIHKKHTSCTCALGTWLSSPHYRSREDSAPLDRGTGKVPLQRLSGRPGILTWRRWKYRTSRSIFAP